MTFIFIVGLIIYLIFLSRRVSVLEEQTKQKVAPQQTFAPSVPIPPAAQAGMNQAETPVQRLYSEFPIPQAAVQTTQGSGFDVVAWIKKDFLVKLGAFLLLLAFGWLVSYAFANNWVGPWGRIIFGVVSGLLVFGFGSYRIKQYSDQGAIFAVLGSTIVIMSIYAAREIYGFFTPASALTLMGVMVALTAVLSVQHRVQGLALASLVIGALAPLFTAAPEPDLFGLSLYLLMLVLGTLWVVFLIEAPVLTPAALLMVAIYSLPYISSSAVAELSQGLVFAFVFTSCFFVGNVVSIINHRGPVALNCHILTGLGTGLYLFFWINGASSGAYENFFYAGWIALFILGGFFVHKRTGMSTALYIYGAVAIAFLAALTANIFSGTALTMVYAVELAALVVATRFIPVERRARQALAWLYIPLGLVSLQHIGADVWVDSVLHKDFAALLIIVVSLLVSGISLRLGREEQQHIKASTTLLITSGTYVLILVALILHALLDDILAMTLILCIYAMVGGMTYIIGLRTKHTVLEKVGAVLSLSYAPLLMVTVNHIDSRAWEDGVMHFDFLALLMVLFTFVLMGVAAMQKAVVQQSLLPAKGLLTAAGFYALTLMWLVLHALIAASVATTVCLVFYTVVGLVLYVAGKKNGYSYIALCGALVISGVVLRLLFVEIWTLSLTARIITFFIIGTLLVSTAFVGKLSKE